MRGIQAAAVAAGPGNHRGRFLVFPQRQYHGPVHATPLLPKVDLPQVLKWVRSF